MKLFLLFLVSCFLPALLWSQQDFSLQGRSPITTGAFEKTLSSKPLQADLTITPDSLYVNLSIASLFISNNTSMPIYLSFVQESCSNCQGGVWWDVGSISMNLPHFVYPGQIVTVQIYISSIVKQNPEPLYYESTMQIVSSVGTQYARIFLNENLVQSIEEPSINELLLFPNPATDKVTIQLGMRNEELGINEELRIIVYDVFGREVEEIKIPNGKDETTLDVSGWPKGMYIIRLVYNNETIAGRKILVQ